MNAIQTVQAIHTVKTIPLNKPCVTGNELAYLQQVIETNKFSGTGSFTARCQQLIESELQAKKIFLTPSGTAALEMTALLTNIVPGDEVIMPSYTFVSTANAFILRGAKIVFVDIRPDTMNIDEQLIEAAITDKTKAIVPVHYAGVACEMDTIMAIAEQHQLIVIEDAAQALFSYYNGKALGTIGDFGCFSFHETKNYSCGEGGAISINSDQYIERAEIIRDKGTNKSQFLRGDVEKYTWKDIGSSYLPSELQSAYLYAGLELSTAINQDRKQSWDLYYSELTPLVNTGHIELPIIPANCNPNAHIFYLKTKSEHERQSLSRYLKNNDIESAYHFIPLHSSSISMNHCRFSQTDQHTSIESEKLLRLPLFYQLSNTDIKRITETIHDFYS